MSAGGRRMIVSRCYNHPDREASARCTVCGRFHCRECVAEHDGRMICGACLRKESPVQAPGGRRWLAWSARSLQACAAIAVAWLVFYAAGRLLLSVPSAFPEGTVWTGDWWRKDPP
jgi:hypothetical protein